MKILTNNSFFSLKENDTVCYKKAQPLSFAFCLLAAGLNPHSVQARYLSTFRFHPK